MAAIFEAYPNAIRMELQMMEQLLGSRLARKTADTGKGREVTVYEISSLGSPAERGVFNGVQPQPTHRAATSPATVPTVLDM